MPPAGPRAQEWTGKCKTSHRQCQAGMGLILSPAARTGLADWAHRAKVIQTVGCSTFTRWAKLATRKVADGERMNTGKEWRVRANTCAFRSARSGRTSVSGVPAGSDARSGRSGTRTRDAATGGLRGAAPRVRCRRLVCHDLLERGNRLEVRWLSGGVVELAEEAGVDTPLNCAVADILSAHADGRLDH